MISFESDYNTGAHPEILRRLIETNMETTPGYGSDHYSNSAEAKIREALECPEAKVYFAVGGTQTNQLVISTMLADYEGVVAAETGHISVHEAGAIEYSGHKVLTVPGHMGKMHADELRKLFESFYADGNHEHMVYPGMVYISQPTEYGSLYSKQEMMDIAGICREYSTPLYVDGARLAYALASDDADFTFADMAKIADVFYIGGTKVGALFGEAIVFPKNNMPKHFLTMAKQRGALLAKGRITGLQFDTLFTDGRYLECGCNAIRLKNRMVNALKAAGFRFFYESPTNQQFVIIENGALEKLREKCAVSFWEPYDADHTVIRFATSWSTTEADIDELESVLKEVFA